MTGAGMKQVTLTGPAKIGGERKGVGAVVTVDADTLAALVASGAVPAAAHDPDATVVTSTGTLLLSMTQADFDAAVLAKGREIAGEAFDGALNKLEDEAKALVVMTEKLEAERDTAIARAIEAESQRDVLQAELPALNARLESEKSAILARAVEAEAQREVLQERVLELQSVLLTQTDDLAETPADPPQDTPPTEKVAETAPKKGAAAKTKG